MLVGTLGTQAAVSLENLLVFQRMISTGLALSAERDHNRLMERILLEAKAICNADGGTLYLRTEDNRLKFEIMRTDSLKIAMGGTTGKPIGFPPLPMYRDEEQKDADGNSKVAQVANHKNIASHAALTGNTVNIPDAYEAKDFDFSGTKKFDEGTGYRSKSFLTVPLKNHQGDVIGVLQLLNARDRSSGEVVPFSGEVQPLVEALASQAAVALDNQRLMEAQKKLFEAFIALIATAIDAKSPYTGGHCQRVPELSMMLARAANGVGDGPFADFRLSDDEMYELQIASLLHDCGKVTTPEYVVDKATKLETIYNRIHEVRTRFEVVKRDAVIDYLRALIDGKGDPDELRQRLEERLNTFDEDYAFVAESNVGGEFMAPEKVERLKRIAQTKWTRTLDDRIGLSQAELERLQDFPAPELPVEETLLFDRPDHIIKRSSGIKVDWGKHGFNMKVPENSFNLGEVYNLSIARGTLTEEERFKINDHIVQTIIMLETLPFPRHLARVAEYAGGHHEMMNGKGYPRGLTGDKMSIPARIMAIADIFEALTATDRPYKPPKKLSEAIKIMSFMKKDGHVDPDLFALFLKTGVYKDYAERFLRPDQLDEVDVDKVLNPPPPPPRTDDGAKKPA
ncbi:MAG: GAF domain-containing protein [Magnetospirillum sp. WYHS-4]